MSGRRARSRCEWWCVEERCVQRRRTFTDAAAVRVRARVTSHTTSGTRACIHTCARVRARTNTVARNSKEERRRRVARACAASQSKKTSSLGRVGTYTTASPSSTSPPPVVRPRKAPSFCRPIATMADATRTDISAMRDTNHRRVSVSRVRAADPTQRWPSRAPRFPSIRFTSLSRSTPRTLLLTRVCTYTRAASADM